MGKDPVREVQERAARAEAGARAAAAARTGAASAITRAGEIGRTAATAAGVGGRPTFAEEMYAAGYQPVPGSDDWFNPQTGDYYEAPTAPKASGGGGGGGNSAFDEWAWQQEFDEKTRQYNQDFSQGQREFDATFNESQFQDRRDYEFQRDESARNYAEQQRQFNAEQARLERQTAAGAEAERQKLAQQERQFQLEFGLSEREFEAEFGQNQRRMDIDENQFAAQFGLEQQRFAAETDLGNRRLQFDVDIANRQAELEEEIQRAEILRNPSDFLARAFQQRGETSPLAEVTQADLLNELANIERKTYEAAPLPPMTPYERSAPGVIPPRREMAPASSAALPAPAPYSAPAPAPAPVAPRPTAPAAPARPKDPRQEFLESLPPPPQGMEYSVDPRTGGVVTVAKSASNPFGRRMAIGGHTTEPFFRVGEPMDGSMNDTEEIIINPERAPIMVIPNPNTARQMSRFAAGTFTDPYSGRQIVASPATNNVYATRRNLSGGAGDSSRFGEAVRTASNVGPAPDMSWLPPSPAGAPPGTPILPGNYRQPRYGTTGVPGSGDDINEWTGYVSWADRVQNYWKEAMEAEARRLAGRLGPASGLPGAIDQMAEAANSQYRGAAYNGLMDLQDSYGWGPPNEAGLAELAANAAASRVPGSGVSVGSASGKGFENSPAGRVLTGLEQAGTVTREPGAAPGGTQWIGKGGTSAVPRKAFGTLPVPERTAIDLPNAINPNQWNQQYSQTVAPSGGTDSPGMYEDRLRSGNITQEEIIQRARETTPPAVRNIMQGKRPATFRPASNNFSLRRFLQLTPAERQALSTRLAAEFNTTYAEELAGAASRFGPATSRPRAWFNG